jgi:hypothetical protein
MCGDVVLYCKCLEENAVFEEIKMFRNNPSYWIYRGEETAFWDQETRNLYGDKKLLEDIRALLHGKQEEILKPGFELWMDVRDPFAVHYVASWQLSGCTFSKTAPDWSPWTKPGVIY